MDEIEGGVGKGEWCEEEAHDQVAGCQIHHKPEEKASEKRHILKESSFFKHEDI